MVKVDLSFNIKYPFLNDIIKVFEQYSDTDNCILDYTMSVNAKPMIDLLEQQFKTQFNFWDYVVRDFKYEIKPNPKKAILCFSGGHDSTNIALKLKDKYDLTLYYLKGVNRAYPNEIDHAKAIAQVLGLPLIIQECSCKGHTSFFGKSS